MKYRITEFISGDGTPRYRVEAKPRFWCWYNAYDTTFCDEPTARDYLTMAVKRRRPVRVIFEATEDHVRLMQRLDGEQT